MIFVNLIYGHFDISVWSGEKKKLCLLGWCQNGDLAPYCKDWKPRYPPNTSRRLKFPWILPRHPPDIPQTPPRHIQGTQHANRQQETPIETARHTQTAPVSVLGCLAVSVGVCWHVVFPGEALGVFRLFAPFSLNDTLDWTGRVLQVKIRRRCSGESNSKTNMYVRFFLGSSKDWFCSELVVVFLPYIRYKNFSFVRVVWWCGVCLKRMAP